MDIKEILRYLGCAKKAPGEAMGASVPETIDEALLEKIKEGMASFPRTFRSTHALFPLSVGDEKLIIDERIVISSKALCKNLKDCTEVIVFAATLGSETDTFIKKAALQDMADGVIVQAIATAYIEECADKAVKDIEQSLRGKFLRPRFSPGYGDFDISHQKDLFSLHDFTKKIGLSLTQSGMLAPIKSITALIGVAGTQRPTSAKNCEKCQKKDCDFRKK